MATRCIVEEFAAVYRGYPAKYAESSRMVCIQLFATKKAEAADAHSPLNDDHDLLQVLAVKDRLAWILCTDVYVPLDGHHRAGVTRGIIAISQDKRGERGIAQFCYRVQARLKGRRCSSSMSCERMGQRRDEEAYSMRPTHITSCHDARLSCTAFDGFFFSLTFRALRAHIRLYSCTRVIVLQDHTRVHVVRVQD